MWDQFLREPGPGLVILAAVRLAAPRGPAPAPNWLRHNNSTGRDLWRFSAAYVRREEQTKRSRQEELCRSFHLCFGAE